MRIKSLKLSNFGQHKNLEIDGLDKKSIIGILGQNGSGKSTVINAIKYAFTGELPDTNTSCIRSGAKSLKVELEFEKNNKLGKIIRSVTHTGASTRELTWEGQVYKKSTEVEAQINEILGIDKQVLSNTIFISQGEFSDILSNTKTKRIDLFSKLLNLNFLNKTVTFIEGEQKTLKESIKDISNLKSKFETDQTNYQQNKEYLEQEEINWKTKFIDISTCELIIKEYDEYNRLIALPTYLENNIKNIKNELASQQLISEEEINVLKTELANKEVEYTKLIQLNSWFDQYTNAKIEIPKLEASIQEATQEIEVIKPQIQKLEKQKTDLEAGVVTLNNVISQLNVLYETKTKLLGKLNNNSVTCPLCGLKLMLGQSITNQDLNSIQVSINAMQLEHKKAEQILNDYVDLLRKCYTKQTMLTTNIAAMQENLSKNLKLLNNFPEVEIDRFKTLTKEDLLKSSNKCLEDKNSLKSKLDQFILQNTLYSKKSQELKKLEAELEQVLFKIEHNGFKSLLVTAFKDNEYINIYNPEEAMCKLKEGVIEFNILNTKRENLNNTLSALNDLEAQINKLEQDNLKTFSNISDLEIVKNTLSIKNNNSVPKQYLKYLFGALVEEINDYLRLSDSNFYVDLDLRPEFEDSLSFKYKKENKDGDISEWLNMNKLSGGEEVKLATTFLIAIQKLICSDLCFLILDEPTTHLDSENVDALILFIRKINTIFNNNLNLGQIWIIDHNPKLENAFEYTIKL